MLQIRPNCEYCDKDLAPDSLEAMICTYECTFCKICVNDILNNVCPNCGGAFCTRPIRPVIEHRAGLSLKNHPASTNRIHTKYTLNELKTFTTQIQNIPPRKR